MLRLQNIKFSTICFKNFDKNNTSKIRKKDGKNMIENQFNFRKNIGTKAILAIRISREKMLEKDKKIFIAFIDA